jgi:hypothetical protein
MHPSAGPIAVLTVLDRANGGTWPHALNTATRSADQAAMTTPSVRGHDVLDVPLDPMLSRRLDEIGLAALILERTASAWARTLPHLADPMATDSQANYTGWLRRQVSAWTCVGLPAVSVAAVDWPLSSVRPQCLDVVGLLNADLRDVAPRHRPHRVPAQAVHGRSVPAGEAAAAAVLCVQAAGPCAVQLAPALELTAGTTGLGSATRFLARCADLAERQGGLARELQRWSVDEPRQSQLAVQIAEQLAGRLAAALEAGTRTGW